MEFGRFLNYYSYFIDCFLSYISLYAFLHFQLVFDSFTNRLYGNAFLFITYLKPLPLNIYIFLCGV